MASKRREQAKQTAAILETVESQVGLQENLKTLAAAAARIEEKIDRAITMLGTPVPKPAAKPAATKTDK